MAQQRDLPYLAFNYLVDLKDGTEGTAQGGFQEVSGLNIELAVVEYRNGNAKTNYVTKIPAIAKAGDVTLKRGVIGVDNIYSWLDQVRSGDVNAKRTVTVKLTDEDPTDQTPVVTWKLHGAMPIKWTGPTVTAKGNTDVAVEELVLAVEHIEQE